MTSFYDVIPINDVIFYDVILGLHVFFLCKIFGVLGVLFGGHSNVTLLLIFLYSKSTCKWLKFEPLFLQDINNKVPMPSSVARKKCTYPVTLTYNDFNPLSNHFNLLIPTGPCCECPEPKNNFETTTTHLNMDGLSHDHMPKDSNTLSKDCMSEKDTLKTVNQESNQERKDKLDEIKLMYQKSY